jgi:chorismate lyase/3-hydroxybenzoate synthase
MLHNFISIKSADDLLLEPNTLAVLDFKNTKSISPDSSHQNSQEPESHTLNSSRIHSEVWKVEDSNAVENGTLENGIWRQSDTMQFVQIDVSLKQSDDYGAVTHSVYIELLNFIQQSPYTNLVRLWNHIPLINQGAGDQENYKLFCSGRLRAFQDCSLEKVQFPAASAVGHSRENITVSALTTSAKPSHHTNPRQVDAFDYPREYGPSSPSFARATTLETTNQKLCFISGTASILGHSSVHQDDLKLQIFTTNDNILYLLKETGFNLSSINTLRVYLRHWHDYEQCKSIVEELYPRAKVIYTQADICRSELLVEIECFCGSVW